MLKVLVLHGPNLNLLGEREPALYGSTSLQEINADLGSLAAELGVEVECRQSNHEGTLIDAVQEARTTCAALLINAGGLTHSSVSLRDAVSAVSDQIKVVEVHLTIPEAREVFRHQSLLAGVVHGRIEGFGAGSYRLALRAASELIGAGGDTRNQ
ncbi:MAG: type II 3-dehydroquinate dehydratase [Myxococcota bacterium]